MQPTIAKLIVILAVAVTPALADTIHGLVVYTRHGDRTFGAECPVIQMLIDLQEPPSSIKDII